MPKLFNPLRRGVIAGATLASLALAAGVLAASAPAASASVTPPDCWWHTLYLVNGWQSEQNNDGTGDPRYCVTGDGMVYLSGSLGQPGGGPDEFATLPAQARPASNLYLSVYTLYGTTGVVQIDTDGAMFAYNGNSHGNVTGFTSLAGVSFPGTTVAQQPLPLMNGWKSAQSEWGTGDPSYSVTGDDVVHLSGSLDGTQVPSGLGDAGQEFAVLPSGARPIFCSSTETYTYAGVPGVLGIEPTGEMDAYDQGGHLYGTPSAQYTSLAGISFPEAAQGPNGKALALAAGWSGSTDSGCVNSDTVVPGYNLINGVVYLSGNMISSSSQNGNFATLPQEARPTHTLYLILNEGPAPHASLQITPNGDMTVFSSGVASGVDSLTGLSYQVSS